MLTSDAWLTCKMALPLAEYSASCAPPTDEYRQGEETSVKAPDASGLMDALSRLEKRVCILQDTFASVTEKADVLEHMFNKHLSLSAREGRVVDVLDALYRKNHTLARFFLSTMCSFINEMRAFVRDSDVYKNRKTAGANYCSPAGELCKQSQTNASHSSPTGELCKQSQTDASHSSPIESLRNSLGVRSVTSHSLQEVTPMAFMCKQITGDQTSTSGGQDAADTGSLLLHSIMKHFDLTWSELVCLDALDGVVGWCGHKSSRRKRLQQALLASELKELVHVVQDNLHNDQSLQLLLVKIIHREFSGHRNRASSIHRNSDVLMTSTPLNDVTVQSSSQKDSDVIQAGSPAAISDVFSSSLNGSSDVSSRCTPMSDVTYSITGQGRLTDITQGKDDDITESTNSPVMTPEGKGSPLISSRAHNVSWETPSSPVHVVTCTCPAVKGYSTNNTSNTELTGKAHLPRSTEPVVSTTSSVPEAKVQTMPPRIKVRSPGMSNAARVNLTNKLSCTHSSPSDNVSHAWATHAALGPTTARSGPAHCFHGNPTTTHVQISPGYVCDICESDPAIAAVADQPYAHCASHY